MLRNLEPKSLRTFLDDCIRRSRAAGIRLVFL
jgi:hypothetical protein